MVLMYDPPSGWEYGFPKPYRPLIKDEPWAVTLLRDGYPQSLIDELAYHTRFYEVDDE